MFVYIYNKTKNLSKYKQKKIIYQKQFNQNQITFNLKKVIISLIIILQHFSCVKMINLLKNQKNAQI